MAKIRVYELAKKLGKPSAQLLDELRALGVDVSSNFSTLDESDMVKIATGAKPLERISKPLPTKKTAPPPPAKAPAPPPPKPPAPKPAPKPAPAKTAPAKAPTPAAPKAAAPPAKTAPETPEAPPRPAPKAAPPQREKPDTPPKAAPVPRRAPVIHTPPPASQPPAPPPVPRHVAPPPPPNQHPQAVKTSRPAGQTSTRPPVTGRPNIPPPPPKSGRPARPAGQPPRPTSPSHPAGQGAPARPGQPRPAAPRPATGRTAPSRQGAPSHGRPAAPERQGGPIGRPQPPARTPQAEPPKPFLGAKPQADFRRKSKRERRMEKLQAREDRKDRLDRELQEAQVRAEKGEAVFIREGISVKELAEKLGVKVKDIIAKLMMRGILATINQPLDGQVAIQVSSMFGFMAEIISYEDELVLTQEEVPEEDKVPRPPVVTVMGHVDHGKSSLLEAIHDVDITSKEAGGITQHIGAYRVVYGGKTYVFLDTPGHEAFTLMRARGAQVTDVVVLVVAADDGVMPQTVEAINHCRAAKVPMIVAINKIDKPGAEPERVKRDLMQHGVHTEDFGGDVVSCEVSAKTRKGIPELLDMISLVADMLNLGASPDQPAAGTVLESKLDRARGSVATVLIQDGTLHVGDLFLCGTTFGHVRNLFDDRGQRIEEAGPSTPVEVLGFSEVPAVGALFQAMTDEAKARQIASFRREQEKAKSQRTAKVSLDNVFGAIQEGQIQELAVILKADVQGSLEAVAQQVQDISTDEVKVSIVHKGVGAISEGDVILASASNAVIIGFNVRPERKATELAKSEGVEVTTYTVIYDLIDRMKQALTGMLKPIEREEVLGQAEVREIFRVTKVGTVAGCMVIQGRIPRSAQIRVLRDNVVVLTGKMASLKRFKDDASEVKEGLECGISLENFNDLKPGDVLEAFEITLEERTL